MHLTNNYIVDIIKSSATGTAFLQNNNKHITKTLKMHKNASDDSAPDGYPCVSAENAL